MTPAPAPEGMAPAKGKPDWRVGWQPDQTQHASPRYTMRGPGDKAGGWTRKEIRPKLHQAREHVTKVSGRDTCWDHLMRQNSWKPGPGSYNTSVEFVNWNYCENQSGVNVKWDGPNYSMPKMMRTVSCPNFKYAKGGYARPDIHSNFWTPGPGHYKQRSTFGMPSGPTRTSYFGTNEIRWRKDKNANKENAAA